MNDKLSDVLKDLSVIYDINSKNTFVSVYLNKHTYEKFLHQREATCGSLLKKEEQKNFIQTLKRIKEFVQKNKFNNLAVFASNKYNFFKAVPLSIEVNNSLIVDSSPYIRPLARIQDEWESFTLVLLNSHYAKIYSISLGKVDREKNLSKDIINRHKKGGQSQARFQRIRKGAIHAFFSEVAEYLVKVADKQIVIAGPGPAKVQFKELLPKHLQDRIVDMLDIGIDNEKEIFEESMEVISEKEEQKSHKAVEKLKQEILKDGLAVYGIDETLQAAKNGQIDLLIIEKDYKIKGCLCEHCQILNAGPIKDCQVCGGPTTEVDVIEEILEFAERTDAQVEFTDDEEISNLGHIGAILRYK
jgi:peptide chain release factor subunit 1